MWAVFVGELINTHFSIETQKLLTRAVILVCELVAKPQKNGLDLVCIIGGQASRVDHVCDFCLKFHPKIILFWSNLWSNIWSNFKEMNSEYRSGCEKSTDWAAKSQILDVFLTFWKVFGGEISSKISSIFDRFT